MVLLSAKYPQRGRSQVRPKKVRDHATSVRLILVLPALYIPYRPTLRRAQPRHVDPMCRLSGPAAIAAGVTRAGGIRGRRQLGPAKQGAVGNDCRRNKGPVATKGPAEQGACGNPGQNDPNIYTFIVCLQY